MIVEETLGEIQTWDPTFYSTISDIARSRFGRTPSLPKLCTREGCGLLLLTFMSRREEDPPQESEATESNPGWKL
jgi:hypothetical protein